ncbi:MAG TPA: DUF3298 domain-containing protein [Pyrinomonadaceae bacterium]|nr:DUF3298 domain-containing protein [Pyrinomonadaceae bacterium]
MKIKIHTHAALIFLLLLLSALAFGLNAGPSNAQETAGTHFKGSVAGARVEMTLRREGNRLSGTYFYAKSGSANKLSLRGEIDANGQFTMQEFDSSGKQTGEFKGTWKDDPNQSGAFLEGEWKKPGAKENQWFAASEQMASFTNGTQIISRQINESVKAKRLDLTAEYPELTGGANGAGFNQLVKSRVTKELADFKKQMIGLSAEDLKMLPQGVNNYIDIGYNIEYGDNELLSVSFLESNFTGGVHPNYNYFTVTYDLKNGREVKLSELFKPGAKYLEEVSAYAIKDLQSRKIPDSDENMGLAQDIFADGATAKAENYQNWNLTKKGLMITFDPYQVGPYAAGSQTVIVPYAKLRELAKPDGALIKMMK